MASDFTQSSQQYLSSIDAEIERLQQIREQVASTLHSEPQKPKPADRPKQRGMSEEGRLRIAEAQKARWAKQKAVPRKTAAKKVPAKKAAVKKAAAKKFVGRPAAAKRSQATESSVS